jgi:hypothetical protein
VVVWIARAQTYPQVHVGGGVRERSTRRPAIAITREPSTVVRPHGTVVIEHGKPFRPQTTGSGRHGPSTTSYRAGSATGSEGGSFSLRVRAAKIRFTSAILRSGRGGRCRFSICAGCRAATSAARYGPLDPPPQGSLHAIRRRSAIMSAPPGSVPPSMHGRAHGGGQRGRTAAPNVVTLAGVA